MDKRFPVLCCLIYSFFLTSSSANEHAPSIRIFDNKEALGAFCADRLIEKIEMNNKAGKATVLGLPTGSTPIPIYQAFRKRYHQGKVDLSKLITFNLDEYVGLDVVNPQSYHYFMFAELFHDLTWTPENPRGIKKENIHIPSGWALSLDDLTEAERQALFKRFPNRGHGKQLDSKEHRWALQHRAVQYEKLIQDLGPIDIMILGIGENGHIGFAEPGTPHTSRTSVVALTENTRRANSRFFNDNIKEVPYCAISMGIDTILGAQEIFLLATGSNKAEIIQKTLSQPISEELPATALKRHDQVMFLLDKQAAARLRPTAQAAPL